MLSCFYSDCRNYPLRIHLNPIRSISLIRTIPRIISTPIPFFQSKITKFCLSRGLSPYLLGWLHPVSSSIIIIPHPILAQGKVLTQVKSVSLRRTNLTQNSRCGTQPHWLTSFQLKKPLNWTLTGKQFYRSKPPLSRLSRKYPPSSEDIHRINTLVPSRRTFPLKKPPKLDFNRKTNRARASRGRLLHLPRKYSSVPH